MILSWLQQFFRNTFEFVITLTVQDSDRPSGSCYKSQDITKGSASSFKFKLVGSSISLFSKYKMQISRVLLALLTTFSAIALATPLAKPGRSTLRNLKLFFSYAYAS